jgi:hypothetical protein
VLISQLPTRSENPDVVVYDMIFLLFAEG